MMLFDAFTDGLSTAYVSGVRIVIIALMPVVLIAGAAPGCSSSDDLTEAEWEKIGASLRAEMQSTKTAGVVWPVVVRTDSAEALRAAGLPMETEGARIVTARWNREQIRTAAQLKAVREISSQRNQPTAPINNPG